MGLKKTVTIAFLVCSLSVYSSFSNAQSGIGSSDRDTSKPQQTAEEIYKQAKAVEKRKDFSAAIELYEQAVSLNPAKKDYLKSL